MTAGVLCSSRGEPWPVDTQRTRWDPKLLGQWLGVSLGLRLTDPIHHLYVGGIVEPYPGFASLTGGACFHTVNTLAGGYQVGDRFPGGGSVPVDQRWSTAGRCCPTWASSSTPACSPRCSASSTEVMRRAGVRTRGPPRARLTVPIFRRWKALRRSLRPHGSPRGRRLRRQHVVVDGAPTETGASTGTTRSTTSSTATSTTTTTTSTRTRGSTVVQLRAPAASASRAASPGIMTGTVPCDGLAFSSYGALVACACGSAEADACKNPCGQNLCKFHPPADSCSSCLVGDCADEFAACSAN